MLNENGLYRYSRQLILKEIGTKGQEKLLKAKVLVIGAGALGSPALYYLAAAGVGTIGIVDANVVEISNLKRQIMVYADNLHRKKVDIAKERLEKLNPYVSIIKYPIRLDVNNIEEVLKEYDVVIDAADNFKEEYLISDCCQLLSKPLVEGALIGCRGIMTTIIPKITPCYRCLYPHTKGKTAINCSNNAILEIITGSIGSLQALEAIKFIVGTGELLLGRLLVFNGLDMSFKEVRCEKNSNCHFCS